GVPRADLRCAVGHHRLRVPRDRRRRVSLHPSRRGARPGRARAATPRGAATGVSSESGPLSPTRRVPAYTLPKPRYRGASHFYALFVAVVAAVALVATAPAGLATCAAALYATTLVAMFGASALYHRGTWSHATAKKLLQLDHTAIFLLIAG